MELHRGHTVFNTKSEGGEFLIKLGFTRVLFISNVKHEGTLNRRTSLAEIWGGGGRGRVVFLWRTRDHVWVRAYLIAIVRFLLFLWVLLLQTLPSSIQGWKIPLRLLDIPRRTFCDVRWSFLEGLAKETIRVRRTVKKRKRKRGEGGKKGGIPNRGIFAALWPWTKTISRDNLVKDHSFPQGTLQRGIFFFSFCNAPR